VEADELPILLGKRFIERRDVKAVQFDKGYFPDRTPAPQGEVGQDIPWRMQDLRDHVNGVRSLGHYMVSPEGKTKLFAFDIDLKKEGWVTTLTEEEILGTGTRCNPREVWHDPNHPGREMLTMQLRCMAEGLAMRTRRIMGDDYHIAISYSGNKGMHVYCFTNSIPALDAKRMALDVLDSMPNFAAVKGDNFWEHQTGYQNLSIEVFPKQEELDSGKDYGNLMRLPLGIHKKTGQRSFFLDCRCPYTELREMDPLDALGGVLPWD
jgi:hypothetical protein